MYVHLYVNQIWKDSTFPSDFAENENGLVYTEFGVWVQVRAPAGNLMLIGSILCSQQYYKMCNVYNRVYTQ